MKKNIELVGFWNKLTEAESVVLFPHVNPDGDSVGACIALGTALENEGIKVRIYSREPVPGYLSFLNTDMFTDDFTQIPEPEACVAVDCSEDIRLRERAEIYNSCSLRLTVDHHFNDEGYGDYYYIDEQAAAASEIVFDMLKSAGVQINKDMANGIFTGISTDTGNFKHANTTPSVFRAAAELLELGADHNNIMVRLYQNRKFKKVMAESKALEKAEIFAGGKASISCFTRAEMAEMGATHEETDEVIDMLRNIEGVEIAAYLEERQGEIKLSLRSKTYSNVNDIAVSFGGGGHAKAAGATIRGISISEAINKVKESVVQAL